MRKVVGWVWRGSRSRHGAELSVESRSQEPDGEAVLGVMNEPT